MVKSIFKYFIGYKDGKNVRPLCILFSRISAYRRVFDETKYMCVIIINDELLEGYNEIWKTSAIALKKDLIVDLYTTNNILKLK